ncbi:hypothetical protein LMG29542_04697 [Paraburkholderia humisilvae]|uniref:Uncharacterized protein n=1 Tax=Paraburkholderia humisilvae TaxID=627669 RepID=A0A6J5EET9_9BURK|nr:hypothetical protein LMG29542_04697 [Paraburkholderia humisilvae]
MPFLPIASVGVDSVVGPETISWSGVLLDCVAPSSIMEERSMPLLCTPLLAIAAPMAVFIWPSVTASLTPVASATFTMRRLEVAEPTAKVLAWVADEP